MRAGGDYPSVEGVDRLADRGGGACGDLDDVREAALAVAGVDALGRVAAEEPLVVDETGLALEDRHADLLGRAGVDRGLVDHQRAFAHRPTDRLAGTDQGREIGLLVAVDGGGHRHDEDPASGKLGGIGREREPLRRGKLSGVDLARAIVSGAQLGDAARVGVETEHRRTSAERRRERQPDVAEADDADEVLVGQFEHGDLPAGSAAGPLAPASTGPSAPEYTSPARPTDSAAHLDGAPAAPSSSLRAACR